MALPCSRAWLDLHRFVVEACVGLGEPYNAIAVAVRSELKALLRDMPRLRRASLMDDTAAANAETQAWIDELMEEPAGAVPDTKSKPGLAPADPKTDRQGSHRANPSRRCGRSNREPQAG